MKTCSPTNSPSLQDNYFSLLLKANLLSKTIVSQAQPTHFFEFNNNSRINWEISSELKIEGPEVVLVSLLLSLNIFDTLYYLNLKLSRDKQTDRQTDRQTDKQAETDIQRDVGVLPHYHI